MQSSVQHPECLMIVFIKRKGNIDYSKNLLIPGEDWHLNS